MAKILTQVRYFGEPNSDFNKSSLNWPSTISAASLISGDAFKSYLPILQIGIQALPGTRFYMNEGDYPIIVGPSGIFELDVNGLSEINKLTFDKASMDLMGRTASAHLIIDIVYDNGVSEEKEANV